MIKSHQIDGIIMKKMKLKSHQIDRITILNDGISIGSIVAVNVHEKSHHFTF